MDNRRWEYCTINIPSKTLNQLTEKKMDNLDELNTHGKEGWKIIGSLLKSQHIKYER
jgi:hypothetical protein